MKRVVSVSSSRMWCGPTAIAAVTNGDFDKTMKRLEVIRQRLGLTRQKTIRSTYIEEVFALIKEDYPTAKRVHCYKYNDPRIQVLWKMCRPNLKALMWNHNHLVAVDGMMICDNHWNAAGQPMWYLEHPRRRIRIRGMIVLGGSEK